MAAKLVERGFGQVEPNRLTAMIDGKMESQAPAYEANSGTTKITQLENGQFLCVVRDAQGVGAPMSRVAVYPAKAITLAEPFLVFSERKIYDEREMASDFVDKAADKVDGTLYPRLFKLAPGDVYTTNTVNELTADVAAGDILYIGATGYLVKADDDSSPTNIFNTVYQFRVDKKYTMPDGQVGVKLFVEPYGA